MLKDIYNKYNRGQVNRTYTSNYNRKDIICCYDEETNLIYKKNDKFLYELYKKIINSFDKLKNDYCKKQ